VNNLKEKSEEIEMELKKVPIDQIVISEGNVRKREITKGLDDLKRSIQKIGLQHPPVAFRKGNRYEVVVGQRRLIAVKELGWETIPLLIRGSMNPMEAKIASLSENIQRLSLPARDMSDVCSYLLDELGSVEKVAEALGVGSQTVKKYLGYRIVPEPVKKLVDKKKITVDTATRIATYVTDEEKASRIAKKVAKMTKPERERVFKIIREDSEAPDEQIIKKAKETKVRKVIIHLSEDLIFGIKNASKDLGLDLGGVIEAAITEWLSDKGYL